MTVTWFDGVTLTAEAALSAAVGTSGVWDTGLWDSATWGPDEVYQDISAYLRQFSTSRRFGREVQAWESGTASLVLDNRDARFSADNLSGPYAVGGITGIRPWRPVRVRATYSGTTYTILKMYAKDWIESYPALAPSDAGDAIVTVPCVDELARLSAMDGAAVTPVGAGELFGARLHRILDSAGHTGGRDIDTGTVTMQDTTLAQNVVTELKLVADSEGGAVYIDEEGTVVGDQQYALIANARSINSQATFGDGGGSEIPYIDMEISGAGDLIANIVSYACAGGTAQLVADAASRALYGDRRDTRTDLVCETDAQALALASWKLSRFKDPERRISSVTIDPRANPSTMFPLALGLKVRDLVTVKRRPPGGITITQYCHIAGIRHAVGPDTWRTTFELFSANPYIRFASSLWDTGLWGSSETDTSAALWFY